METNKELIQINKKLMKDMNSVNCLAYDPPVSKDGTVRLNYNSEMIQRYLGTRVVEPEPRTQTQLLAQVDALESKVLELCKHIKILQTREDRCELSKHIKILETRVEDLEDRCIVYGESC